MRTMLVLAVVVAIAACGVETVGTAATGAAIKKQELELEQGQATMQQMQQRIDDMNRQAQQRAEQAGSERQNSRGQARKPLRRRAGPRRGAGRRTRRRPRCPAR